MNVLLVGGGAREHALAWRLLRDDPATRIVAAPGNPGIASLAADGHSVRCAAIGAEDVAALLSLARAERIDLTVVGPEAPLAAGIADVFRGEGLAVFGPGAAAAEIESSKTFAKRLMLDAGVPTARAERHTDAQSAKRAAWDFGAPVVIKASGLAAGKGVVVAPTLAEADDAIDAMLVRGAFGRAGAEILVEEFMDGEELSLLALADGERALPLLPAQDHKRLLDGDRGPNTGGMGAYAPVALGTDALVRDVVARIMVPTLAAMRDAGREFRGLLYAGLMLTRDGPKVVEFNCRFGDPETEAILPLLASPLLPLLDAVANGESLGAATLDWTGRSAVTSVVAADGYPETPRKGDVITLPPLREDVTVFHAGTARDAEGRLVTAGGRVLAITATADSFAEAQRLSAEAAAAVEFRGKQHRADIGWRERERQENRR